MTNDLIIGFIYGIQFSLFVRILISYNELNMFEKMPFDGPIKSFAIAKLLSSIMKMFFLMVLLCLGVIYFQM